MPKPYLYYDLFKVKIYYFGILWTTRGLLASSLSLSQKSLLNEFFCNFPTEKYAYIKSVSKYKKHIYKYFLGKPITANIKIDSTLFTPWQKKIYKIIRNIPYGSILSYKDIAVLANKKAYRAIGSALNRNKLLLFIPCHRVVKCNGQIGGFSKGTKLKKYFLSIENLSF